METVVANALLNPIVMEMLEKFIKPELLVLVVVLYLIGWMLKKAKWFPDQDIPVVLNCISIALVLIYLFSVSFPVAVNEYIALVFTAIVQGILLTGAAINANQIYKQSKKE